MLPASPSGPSGKKDARFSSASCAAFLRRAASFFGLRTRRALAACAFAPVSKEACSTFGQLALQRPPPAPDPAPPSSRLRPSPGQAAGGGRGLAFRPSIGAVLASQTNHVHEGAGHRRGRRLVARDVRRPARTIPGGPEAAAATPSAVESSPGGPELGWGDLRLVSRHGALWAKSKGEEARRKPCEPPGHQLTPCEPTSAGGQQLRPFRLGGGKSRGRGVEFRRGNGEAAGSAS